MAEKAGARLCAAGLEGTVRHVFGRQGSGGWSCVPLRGRCVLSESYAMR